jgi:hypothetical protein
LSRGSSSPSATAAESGAIWEDGGSAPKYVSKKQREKTSRLINQGHFKRQGQGNSRENASSTCTISTKDSTNSGKKSSSKKGTAFVAVKDKNIDEDEEAKELPT